MKKKIMLIVMTVTMAMVGGCGNQTETNNYTKDVITESNTEITEVNNTETIKEDVTDVVSSDKVQEFNPVITEKDDSELNLKDYHDYLEDKTLCTDDNVFSNGTFEFAKEGSYFQTTKKVSMYASNGIRTGYIKEDVGFSVIAICGDWCYFYMGNDKRYARLSEIEANSLTLEEVDAMIAEREAQAKADAEKQQSQAKPVESIPLQDTSIQDESPASEPVEVSESNKYTPEEAMAVYRSIMDGGGIVWDPSLKDVSSWGTGFFYLDKDYIQWAGETNLESFAMGDSGGNPWTRYYFEITGSDDECVYFTEWHN